MVPLFKRKPQELLTDLQAVNNIEELEKVLIGRKKPLSGLRNAIALFEQQEQLNFMETILPALQTFLREPHSLTTLPLLQAQTNSSVQLSHKEMRFILTNAFLLNIKNMPQDGYGFFDFGLLMIREDKIGQERLKCMLAYFLRELNSDDTKIHKPISIERFCEEPFDFPDWKTCGELIHPENVVVHTGRIEDVVGTWDIHSEGSGDSRITIVDFANMQIHIGHIMASTTQEEVLFSCSPECFLCLLLCEQMLPQEVVLVRNVRRSVEYRGFLRTFQQTGTIMDAAPMDVLALDASCRDSFRPVTIIRDLNKAWVGFKNSTDVISTGHWGCGAFGGDKLFKFIQQICAASLAGKKLQYSTYNEEDTAQQFKTVLSKLVEQSKTIGDIVKFLLEYGASPATNFTEYVSAWLE